MMGGSSSGKGSTQSKVPQSSQRNEYLSVQQTKNQYGNGNYATQRGHQGKTKEEQKQQLISMGQEHQYSAVETGGSQSGIYTQRTKKDSNNGLLTANQSAANLSATKKNWAGS